jgi:hypothetical protein
MELRNMTPRRVVCFSPLGETLFVAQGGPLADKKPQVTYGTVGGTYSPDNPSDSRRSAI